jgi:surface protein
VQDGSGTLNNCLFVSNSANNDGGGLCTTDFVATVLNCTFNFNSSNTNGGAIASRGGDFTSSITVRNTIIWGNAGSGVLGLYTTTSPVSTPTVTYSDIQGSGVFAGTGNINADPLFVSTSDRDGADDIFGTPDDGLQLSSGSPALNTGNNTGVSTTDLTGGVRLVGSTVDMGAYERCDLTPTATTTTPVLCVGQSISLSANGGSSYSWAGPTGSSYSSSSQNPTAFAATSTSFNGVYSVTVSSSAVGCSVSVTTSVYVNTTLRVSASTVNYPIVCVGQNISLQATESWPSYSWQGPAGSGYTSNAQNPATFSPTSTAFNGGYTVTATFGTCTGSASVSVQVLPTIEASVSPTTVSVGQSVQLSVTNPANAWFLYGWRGPSGSGYSSTSQNPSAFVASSTAFSGIFSVTAVGGDCSATATATVSLAVATNRPFITRWDLSKTGSGTNNQLSFGVGTTGTVNYTWQEVGGTNTSGSGTFTGSTATITGLPTNGTIDLSIEPANFQRININNGTDRSRLTGVSQWGDVAWTDMSSAFYGCDNLNITATDIPNLAGVTSMVQMFRGCSVLNGPSNINSWNVGSVTSMQSLFLGATIFNQNIGSWNVSAVTRMSFMFLGAKAFNQNIGGWNVGAVTNMSSMFNDADAFNQNIGGWNVGAVTNMSSMFENTDVFNQNIGSWTVDAVTDMSYMFAVTKAFNQNIGGWNVAAVKNMSYMFNGAQAFDQNIGGWNVGAVTNMNYMFSVTKVFNQNISGWNVSNVTSMYAMFIAANAFNQDLSAWNVANVTTMSYMFSSIPTFNQSLAAWGTKLNASVDLTRMLDNCGMSVTNYDATLIGFNNGSITGRNLGAANLQYCAAQSAHSNLRINKGWTIAGDVFSTVCLPPAFTGMPSSVSVCAGLGTSFSVTVNYESTYAWQVNTGSGFVNLTTGGVYSGVNTTTLNISNVSGLNGYLYRCVASNTNGSTNSDAATLTVNSLPTLPVVTPAAQCGGSLNLSTAFSSNGTLSYFNDSGFTSSATNPVTTSGPYYARATLGSCTNSASVSITINALPTISVSVPAAQCGGSLNLSTAFSSNGTLSYFNDSGFTSSATNPVTTSGQYYARTMSTASCSATASVSITINSSATVSVSVPAAQCGGSINLNTAFSSNGTLSYFNDSGFTSSATNPVTTSGTYYARATLGSCTNSASVSITINALPTISVSVPAAQCGGSINLSTAFSSNGTLSYFNDSGFTSSATNPVTTSGTYYARAMSTASCSATASVSVNISSNPSVNVGSLTPLVCVGGNISLTASGGGSGYTWQGPAGSGYSSNNQNPSFTASSAAFGGIYSLTVQYPGGCTASNTTNVQVSSGPSVSSNNPVCAGNTLQLNASGGSSYSWSGPSFSSTAQNPSRTSATTGMSGTYSVRIASTAGCTGTVTLTVSVVVSPRNAIPTVTSIRVNGQLPNNQNTVSVLEGAAVNFSVTAFNTVTYSWRSSTGFSSTLQNPSIANASVANAGQYVVVAQNGCQFFGARTVNVAIIRSSRVSAAKEETKLSLQLSVAPNPVTDWLAIRADGVDGSALHLRVVDVQGRSCLRTMLEPVEGKAVHRFDLRPLPVGLYLLEAEDQHGQRATVKVVKY